MNTRALFCLIFIASAVLSSSALERTWSEGPLTWDDFTASPLLDGSASYMAADIKQNSRVISRDGIEEFSINPEAVMYPDRSYADSASRTPELLRLYQTQFDFLEVLTRRYRKELAEGMNGIEADRRLRFYNNLYNSEAKRMAQETDYGSDDARLQFFEYDVRRQLEDIGTPEAPRIVPDPWKYGAFVGVGGIFPTGGIADRFSGACDFVFGLIGGYRRFRLEGQIAYGISTLRDQTLVTTDYASVPYHANVKNANGLQIGFNGGFAVLDTKRFSIIPYVGGMWTSYSWTARPMSSTSSPSGEIVFDGLQQRMQVDNFNVTFGVNFEWHFHSVVTDFPIFGTLREEYISSLRLTPFATRAVFDDTPQRFSGWQIGFTVSYSGIGRALRIK